MEPFHGKTPWNVTDPRASRLFSNGSIVVRRTKHRQVTPVRNSSRSDVVMVAVGFNPRFSRRKTRFVA